MLLPKSVLPESILKWGVITVSIATSSSLITFFSLLAHFHHQKSLEIYRTKVFRELTNRRANLESELNSTLFINRGLAAYVRSQQGIDPQLFWELAKELYEDSPHIRNLGIAPHNIITNVYPLEGNEKAIGLNYLQHPLQKQAVLRAMQTRSTVLAGPVALVQGGHALISRTPIFIPSSSKQKDTYWGIVSIVIDVDSLFTQVGIKADDGELLWAIRGKDGTGSKGTPFFGYAEIFQQDPLTLPINIPGGTWELAVVPKQGWNVVDQVSLWFLASSYLFSLLFGFLVYSNLSYQLTLRKLVDHDLLTNLPNRRFFSKHFTLVIEQSKRHQRPGAVFVLDLDGFKQINDTYGHFQGDFVLKILAERFLNALRSSDMIARVGGDEFWVLLTEIQSFNDVIIVAQRLIEIASQPIRLPKGLTVTLGVSIGIALFPEHGLENEQLIELADLALYQAKGKGKNCFQLFDS